MLMLAGLVCLSMPPNLPVSFSAKAKYNNLISLETKQHGKTLMRASVV